MPQQRREQAEDLSFVDEEGGTEAVVQFLGISMQEEQEFVMIIVPREKKSLYHE